MRILTFTYYFFVWALALSLLALAAFDYDPLSGMVGYFILSIAYGLGTGMAEPRKLPPNVERVSYGVQYVRGDA